jgi:hypothetical protein
MHISRDLVVTPPASTLHIVMWPGVQPAAMTAVSAKPCRCGPALVLCCCRDLSWLGSFLNHQAQTLSSQVPACPPWLQPQSSKHISDSLVAVLSAVCGPTTTLSHSFPLTHSHSGAGLKELKAALRKHFGKVSHSKMGPLMVPLAARSGQLMQLI